VKKYVDLRAVIGEKPKSVVRYCVSAVIVWVNQYRSKRQSRICATLPDDVRYLLDKILIAANRHERVAIVLCASLKLTCSTKINLAAKT